MATIDYEKETLEVLKPFKEATARAKFNTFWTGMLSGLLIPALSIYIFHLFLSPRNFTFTDFINYTRYFQLTSSIISLCVIPNLLLFFIFIWTEKYFSARGVITATLVYVTLVLIIKFII